MRLTFRSPFVLATHPLGTSLTAQLPAAAIAVALGSVIYYLQDVKEAPFYAATLPVDGYAPVMVELRTEQREVARTRILTGARSVLVERGFEGTIDDVAAAAGVSRRTVFRHFTTHDALLVEAINEIVVTVRSNVPGPPQEREDVETWLTDAAVQLHTLHARLVGRAFWDVHVPRSSVSPEIVAVLGDLERRRRDYGTRLAVGAWTSLGGSTPPPVLVIDAFLLQLSPFARHAFAQYSPEEVGRACAKIIWTVLLAALSEPPSGHGKSTAG